MKDRLSRARDTPDRTGSGRQTEQWRSSSEPPSDCYHFLFYLPLLLGLCLLSLFRLNILIDIPPAIAGIQGLDDLADCGIDLFIGKNLLGRIHEEQVEPSLYSQKMLLPAPTLTDTPFQEVALDCALEHLLRHRHHDTVHFRIGTGKAQITEARHIAVLTFGKKP